MLHVARAVGLAEGVAAGDESDGFLVIHGHAGEGFADVARGCDGVGVAVGTFGVDIDKAHLDGGKGIGQLAVATVAFIAEPGRFRTPVGIQLRLPDIFTSAAEAEGLEAH